MSASGTLDAVRYAGVEVKQQAVMVVRNIEEGLNPLLECTSLRSVLVGRIEGEALHFDGEVSNLRYT